MKTNETCCLLDDYLDESLQPKAYQKFAQHLSHCKSCSLAVAQWSQLNSCLENHFQGLELPTDVRVNYEKTIIQDASRRLPSGKDRSLLALAALLILSITIATSYLLTTTDPGSVVNLPSGVVLSNQKFRVQVVGSSIENALTPAAVDFDEKTIGVLEHMDSELTVYRIYPKRIFPKVSQVTPE